MGSQPDEIKQRISVDDQATDKIKKVGEVTRELGNETQKSRQKMSEASQDAGRLSRGLGGLQGGIGGVVSLWGKFVAGAAGAIAILREFMDTARKASEVAALLGTQIKGFAANVGGARADRLIPTITAIAKEQNIGLEGRDQLFEAITSETDVNPDLTNQ